MIIDADSTPGVLSIICTPTTSLRAQHVISSLLTARPARMRKTDSAKRFYFAIEDYETLGSLLYLAKAPEFDNTEITPAAESAILAYRDTLEWIRRIRAYPDSEWLSRMERILHAIPGWKTKPYVDQLQCLLYHITSPSGRSIEGGETGIGKSLILIYVWLFWRFVRPEFPRGLILATNSGKYDWEKEVRIHTEYQPYLASNGTKSVEYDIEQFVQGTGDIFIIHYDALATLNINTLRRLSEARIGWVGIDEVHLIKNPETIRHKRVMNILSMLPHARCTCATGTIIDGSPKSAWAPLSIVVQNPHLFPTYRRFCAQFIRYAIQHVYTRSGSRSFRVEVGLKNLSQLHPWISRYVIRFRKDEVSGRPSKVFQTRIVTLHGDQKKLYEAIRDSVKKQIAETPGEQISLRDITNVTLRLRQVLNHPHVVEEFRTLVNPKCTSAKYLALDDLLEEILSNPKAKVLVWTQWRKSVELLVERYAAYHAVPFYGGSDVVDVRKAVTQGPARVVVAIPEKAGTSVDFLKVCRTAIYLEKPFSLTLYRQSLDRIDRRDNIDSATIISIEGLNTVDQAVNYVLQSRQNVFDVLTIPDEEIVALQKRELLEYLR